MEISKEEIKKLVIERIKTMPATMKVSLGNSGEFNKEQLIEEVKQESGIGDKIIEVHLSYLRSLSK